MAFRGVVRDGVVVLPEDLDLPNGAEVDILPRRTRSGGRKATGVGKTKRGKTKTKSKRVPLSKRLASVIGKAKGLPRDASRNIDHYLYGAAKR